MPHRSNSPARHILTFAQTLSGGGVERALLRLAAGWIESGRRVTLLIGSREGPLGIELPQGIDIVELGERSYGALLRAAPAAVQEHGPDVIFCPGNHYSSIAAWTRLRLGHACPPIVAKLSNALVRPDMARAEAWAYRRWLRLHPRFVDQLVAMSRASAAEAIRATRMPEERVSVIPNPPPRAVPGAAQVALPEGRFLLGVGRLEAQKRWDRLIDAMPRLNDRGITLMILGEGRMRGALEARIRARGLAGRVVMPGHAADPMPAIARAQAVVLTSDFEGVPGVIREARQLGTPVVTTDSSVSVRELIASPAQGDVVKRGDAAALVAAIDRWLSPGAIRPAPAPDNGNPAEDYLALFDRAAADRR